MAYWFSKYGVCTTVTHIAESWDDIDYWDDGFSYTCYDMSSDSRRAVYIRNTGLAMRLVVNRLHELDEVGEVTMGAILSAMLQANPNQVRYFVGLVDAYRQSIWNQPFNEEFFAALARGFEQWP